MYRMLLRRSRPILKRIVPKGLLWYCAHRFARWRLDRYLRRQVGPYWIQKADPGPAMSQRLRTMTRALNEQVLTESFSDDRFFFEAYDQMYHFLAVLERQSFNLRTMAAVLEFGCGSARLLRLLRCIEGVRLVGTDANSECVRWCQRHVPGPEYYINNLTPPLAFAQEASFDLVYAHSVFTHIPLELQKPWLEEMWRILRPGGFFLCTVLGWNYRDVMLRPEHRERLQRLGELTLSAEDPDASLSTRVTGSWDVFQTRARVIECFREKFELLDFLPAVQSSLGQDLLVLRKQCAPAAARLHPEPTQWESTTCLV